MENNNKRIVKNTMMLYLRMLFVIIIGLYTSRVVLQVLGVTDYGIYNVVGGIVSMFSFLNGALAGSTTRFLTFEIGKKDTTGLKEIFSSAFAIHFVLSIVILIFLETIGLWLVCEELTIPQERLHAAIVVFHLSVITCMVEITQVPYNAIIIAHERMNVFAYIGIFNAIAKLLIVYCLSIGSIDKLILYAILYLFVSLTSALIYRKYCYAHFSESHFCLHLVKKKRFFPMLSFATWDLYGNLSVTIRGQGLNVLQNIFFGPVVNAATAISNQVLAAIMGFADNFLTAVKPQIVKSYAEQDMTRFNNLIINSSKYSTLLLFLISFPILLEAGQILRLWLVNVPDYAVIFCQLTIVNNWISIMFRPVIYGVHATGSVKRISLINGTIYILVLPLSYVFLKMGGSPVVPFILNIVLLIIGHFIFSLSTISRQIPAFKKSDFLKKSSCLCFLVMVLSSIAPLISHFLLPTGYWQLISMMVSVISTLIVTYYIALNQEERNLFVQRLKQVKIKYTIRKSL